MRGNKIFLFLRVWDGGIQMRGQDSLSRTRQYMHFKRYVKHVVLFFLYIYFKYMKTDTTV